MDGMRGVRGERRRRERMEVRRRAAGMEWGPRRGRRRKESAM